MYAEWLNDNIQYDKNYLVNNKNMIYNMYTNRNGILFFAYSSFVFPPAYNDHVILVLIQNWANSSFDLLSFMGDILPCYKFIFGPICFDWPY